MSTCTRCGTELGLFHRGPLCSECRDAADAELAAVQVARLHEADRLIVQLRQTGGADAAAKRALADLVTTDDPTDEEFKAGRSVPALAIAAVEEELRTALSPGDQTGADDERMVGFLDAITDVMPTDVALAKAIFPHLTDLQVREIHLGKFPTVQAPHISLDWARTKLCNRRSGPREALP